ncbi:MAG TPA: hypothetical protein VMH28_15330 [Candidatus Acidoferrales bacterium]|nr:hypothetical protein [Candidatus Acidoferrales bacterium]
MKHGEKLAPIAALVSALSCLACCLPFGIAAAVGAAGLSIFLDSVRPYLLGIAGALLLFGLWQLYRSRGTCQRRSRTGLAIFWTSALIVTSVAVVPQVVASLFAGSLPANASAHAADLSIEQFQAEFNGAADRARVIVLLSPT